MFGFSFKHVCIQSYGLHLPTTEVTSAELEDRLAPLYQRLQIPFGTLEKISGVKTRSYWDRKTRPSEVATIAAKQALEQLPFDASQIQALFSCSVSRDYFEPATATLIAGNLQLREDSLVMDLSNACIGVSDGLFLLGNLIESGIVKAGMVVSGEAPMRLIEASMQTMLKQTDLSRDALLELLPALTLGAGAVAFVLCHDSIATTTHRIVGGAMRSATQHNGLCVGNADTCVVKDARKDDLAEPIMFTEASKLIASAAKLGGRIWPEASRVLGWKAEEIDHIFCHQVGKQVNNAFYEEEGLDIKKEFTIYKKYGNLVSAALPAALIMGVKEKPVRPGEKILLTGYGSGLNGLFTGIVW